MRRLRMGMIGGGPGAFIGPVHRMAAELDREIELVAGAFSATPAARARPAGAYRIDPDRAYPDIAPCSPARRRARTASTSSPSSPPTTSTCRPAAPPLRAGCR